jgi:hypothetical protein
MMDCWKDPTRDLEVVEFAELSIDSFHGLREPVTGLLESSFAFSDDTSWDRFWSLSN